MIPQPQQTSVAEFPIGETVKRIAAILPRQGPIKDFIALNPLHGFQSEPFEVANRKASEMFGARRYLPAEFYQRAFSRGEIRLDEIERVAKLRGFSQEIQKETIALLQSEKPPLIEPIPPGWAKRDG